MFVIEDKDEIGRRLRGNVALHIYELGDLDPFFWPSTRFFATDDALCLLYQHPAQPTLLALCDPAEQDALNELLRQLATELPDELYVHLSPGLTLPGYDLRSSGEHLRMLLTAPRLPSVPDAVPLTSAHVREIEAFYEAAYPGNWFDQRMLETGCYFGLRMDGVLASVAGIHVYSQQQRVAALGNIATAHRFRRQGLGRRATAACCHHLQSRVDVIGLNVKADNAAAIACYHQLGFERVASYDEGLARRAL